MTETKPPFIPPSQGGQKLKILVTGGGGMLAYDFSRTQRERYDIILVDRAECDITSFASVMQSLSIHEPDIVLNSAAYTAVDDAEDIGREMNYEVNTLGVYNLAKATSVFGVDFITISTDYVFDGSDPHGYSPTDECHPINAYGMAKYLGEKLALDVNPRTIIVRTSWLYGGISGMMHHEGGIEEKRKHGEFKNFVNTMLKISETRTEIKVVSDQHGIPTSCVDLSFALTEIIEGYEDLLDRGESILHLPNACSSGSITWADFAREVFRITEKNVKVTDCTSSEYPTKARRPEWSILKNTSDIILPDWKSSLEEFLSDQRGEKSLLFRDDSL